MLDQKQIRSELVFCLGALDPQQLDLQQLNLLLMMMEIVEDQLLERFVRLLSKSRGVTFEDAI